MKLLVKIDQRNDTQSHWLNSWFGESAFENKGDLYRSCLKEYGRCTGKLYIDDSNDKPKQIGWCFSKREKYSDSNESFLMETFISIHKDYPVTTVKYHYA